MRITIVQGPFLPVPPLRGGAVERVWFELGKAFARRGHDVTHVSRRFAGLPDEEIIEGVRHLRVPGFDSPGAWRPFLGIDLIWPLRLVYDFIYARRVRRCLPHADLVVTNTFWLPVLLLARSAMGALYVHIARFPKSQVRWYRHAARLQTVSSFLAEKLREIVPEAAGQVQYLPNPLLTSLTVRSEAELTELAGRREKLIVFTGRVHPQKGLEILLEAFSSFAHTSAGAGWKLRVVGPAEAELGGGGVSYLQTLKARASPLGKNVEWTGFVAEPSELKRHLTEAGIYVYPSIDRFGEASPVAPLEAMACGCPTVVSNLDCFRDYLTDGQDGWTFAVDRDDPAASLGRLLESIASDLAGANEMAHRGWLRSQNFDLETVATRYLEDFEALTRSTLP